MLVIPSSLKNKEATIVHKPSPKFQLLVIVMPAFESRSEHPLYLAWLINSGIGVLGMLLNGLVLFFFYIERRTLISSVNAMIL